MFVTVNTLTKYMYTNSKIRISPVGIYLRKVINENSTCVIWCVICSKLTKKRHQNDFIDMKTLKNIEIALVSLLLTLKRFHNFSQYLFLEFREVIVAGWVSQQRSKYRQVKIMKHARTDANYDIRSIRSNYNMKRNLH